MSHDIPTDRPSRCEDARVFCCPHCDAPIGTTDGQRLTVGAVIIESPIELTYLSCKERYHWQPGEPN
jgi:hypothetical protein